MFETAQAVAKYHSDVKVYGPMKTLQEILRGASLARLGDGEIKFALWTGMPFQDPSESLQKKMLEVLRSRVDGLLIGVPYHTDEGLEHLARIAPPEVIKRIWEYRAKLNAIWDPNKEYYSTFVTRPDNFYMEDYSEFFALWRTLWANRDIVAVQSKTRPFVRKGTVESHRSLEVIEIPPTYAWNEYDRILSDCLKHPKDRLFLLAAGPSATALAHDLHIEGYQAVDVGHLWRWLQNA